MSTVGRNEHNLTSNVHTTCMTHTCQFWIFQTKMISRIILHISLGMDQMKKLIGSIDMLGWAYIEQKYFRRYLLTKSLYYFL